LSKRYELPFHGSEVFLDPEMKLKVCSYFKLKFMKCCDLLVRECLRINMLFQNSALAYS